MMKHNASTMPRTIRSAKAVALVTILVLCVVLTLSACGTTATGPVKKTDYGPGSATGWSHEGECWFYYQDGTRLTGWHELPWDGGTSWFHFEDTTGVMQIGFQQLVWEGGEDWFYFDEKTGALQTTGTVTCLGSDGKNHKFAIGSSGVLGAAVD